MHGCAEHAWLPSGLAIGARAVPPHGASEDCVTPVLSWQLTVRNCDPPVPHVTLHMPHDPVVNM